MIIAPYITDKRIINKFKGLEKIFKHTGNTEVFTENIYQMYLQETLDG